MDLKKSLLVGILVVIPALLLAYPQVGDPAPDFSIPDTAGVNHALSEFRGRCVELVFWQST